MRSHCAGSGRRDACSHTLPVPGTTRPLVLMQRPPQHAWIRPGLEVMPPLWEGRSHESLVSRRNLDARRHTFALRCGERFPHIPVVANTPHQERAIQLGYTRGKSLAVVGGNGLCHGHLERLDLPVAITKL